MGIIGEMRDIPQTWDEYLMGLLGRPINAIADFSKGMQSQDWSDPIGALINAPYAIAQAFTERPGQALQEASEGMPLTRDAGGFPPDSPVAFLNQGLNERASGVIDGMMLAAPVAGRVVRAAKELPGIIGDAAMEAYGPRRAASWMFLSEDAPGANQLQLGRAQALEEGGIDPKKIWQRTGWFRSPSDNQWLYEIDDSGAKLTSGSYAKGTRLGKYWKHPELYSHMPGLEDLPVKPGVYSQGNAAYAVDPLLGPRLQMPAVPELGPTAHEVQHTVQHHLGMPFGGSPERMLTDPQTAAYVQQEGLRIWDEAVAQLKSTMGEEGAKNWLSGLSPDSLARIAAKTQEMAQNNIYRKLTGEAMARLTADSVNMTAAERAASFPPDRLAAMLQREGIQGGPEGLIPRFINKPSDPYLANSTGILGGEEAMVTAPKRGWKFGDPIEGDFPAPGLIDDLLQGRQVSPEALAQFEQGAKKAGHPAEWIKSGKQRLEAAGEEASAAAHAAANDSAQVHDFVDDVVVRIGVLNTPALSGERFKRVRAVMDAIERGDISIDVPKLGSMMPGEMVNIKIPKEIRGKKVREMYNVPINDPILRKPRPPDFTYPIVVTGNPHLTNFIRPDPSWDSVIKTVRIKPVFGSNEKVENAVASAINYGHEIGARPLVTTFRDNSLWRINKYTDLLPKDPKDPAFATYWKKNPDPPSKDPNMRPHYNEYLPREPAKGAYREAGWDTAVNIDEVHATGKEWYPRSRELSDGTLAKIKDKEGPIEYCDALGAGCTSCRNCAKTTQPKESHQSPIVGCTDEPWCKNACPGCFVPRATKGSTKGRMKIALGANVKQGGYGKADLGDAYKGTVDVLQGVMRSQQGPVNYAARFMTLDPAGQADMAVSLYTSGLIGNPEYQTMLKEIRGASGVIGSR
jgi:hypothetical protein